MARRANLELREKIWKLYCNDPNQARIGKKLGVDRALVNYHIQKLRGELNYRLNIKTIEEFAEYRLAVMDSLREEIAELGDKIEFLESQQAYDLALKYRDYRKELKLDLYKVMGDGEAVLSLKHKMAQREQENEGLSNRLTQGA